MPVYEQDMQTADAAAQGAGLTGRISPVFAVTALVLTVAGFALSVIRPAMPETDWKDEIDAEIASDTA